MYVVKLFLFLQTPTPIPVPSVSQGSLLGETNITTNGFGEIGCDCLPPPIPFPGVSQSSLPGEKYRKKCFSEIFMIFEKWY